MTVRKAEKRDLSEVLETYAYAREFMKKTGNPTQWGDKYPSRELIESDIEKGDLYVVTGEKGEIRGAFMFKIFDDPTYRVIEDGNWLNGEKYGVVHRVASNGKEKGVLSVILDFCFAFISNIRMDTHENNSVMRRLLEKNGFVRCGVIHVADGTPRTAYQKTLPKKES